METRDRLYIRKSHHLQHQISNCKKDSQSTLYPIEQRAIVSRLVTQHPSSNQEYVGTHGFAQDVTLTCISARSKIRAGQPAEEGTAQLQQARTNSSKLTLSTGRRCNQGSCPGLQLRLQ